MNEEKIARLCMETIDIPVPRVPGKGVFEGYEYLILTYFERRVTGVIDIDWMGEGDKLTYVAMTKMALLNMGCEGISSRCGTYETLPKEMKTNLIKYTAEVISSPRKDNHGEGAVKTFVNNLAQNLYMNNVSAINT